ncbi:unnamed protein product, partial [Rotaria sp. Silwood1]
MCGMMNAARSSKTVFNFTLSTGNTIPDKNLGPTRDHTTNSTSGGFLYWDRHLPLTSTDYGTIYTSTVVVENFNLCVKFAYYVKSTAINKNGTTIILFSSYSISRIIWFRSLDDSQGWQTAIAPVNDYLYDKTFSFYVNQTQSVPVSVAFDDIEIDQCTTLTPTTTTTTTMTTTTTTTTKTSTSSTTLTTIISSSSTITRKTSTPVQTTPIKCGTKLNYIVNARSGSHSYEGYGLGSIYNNILINIEAINYININEYDGISTFGAGAKNCCEWMGLAGHAFGDGQGFLGRLHGLLSDNILEMKTINIQ